MKLKMIYQRLKKLQKLSNSIWVKIDKKMKKLMMRILIKKMRLRYSLKKYLLIMRRLFRKFKLIWKIKEKIRSDNQPNIKNFYLKPKPEL